MPVTHLLALIGAVVVAAAVTVLLLLALPSSVRPWLIPVLMVAALAVRASARRG